MKIVVSILVKIAFTCGILILMVLAQDIFKRNDAGPIFEQIPILCALGAIYGVWRKKKTSSKTNEIKNLQD